MPLFQRRPAAPVVKGGYQQFRPFVREDFAECCAYCLLAEILAGGQENFQLDHFRPQSLFPALIKDFYNLYYTCYSCNHGKLNAWPSAQLEALGYCFIDYCQELFSTHFREAEDGQWLPLTPAATYTETRLRLNRDHLIRLRGWLRKLAILNNDGPINWDEPSKQQIESLLLNTE